ncbi:MAG: hypothetical protein M1115_01430 [Actinobacteria bacterium]|nr:hypothetical protein [Actinomycetota bacterium]
MPPSCSQNAALTHPKASEPAFPCLLMLCTGNAARSVMAGAIARHVIGEGPPETGTVSGACSGGSGSTDRRGFLVMTAGTHAVEGQPMSPRTRSALNAIGLDGYPTAAFHRSHQLTEEDLSSADLVVAMAREHVDYVRRYHPEAASKTATLHWLVEHLPQRRGHLAERLGDLNLSAISCHEQGEVSDPAGGDDAQYLACAKELAELVPLLVMLTWPPQEKHLSVGRHGTTSNPAKATGG